MNNKELQEVIKALSESSLTYLEIQEDGGKLILKKGSEAPITEKNTDASETYTESIVKEDANSKENSLTLDRKAKIIDEEKSHKKDEIDDEKVVYITSPIVGTLYLSPSPKDAPFITKGSKVTKGQVVCIIEAMKLMNEIQSPYNGTVLEVLCKSDDMVEYGQNIIKILED